MARSYKVLIVVLLLVMNTFAFIPLEQPPRTGNLTLLVGEILCRAQLKEIFVYFENETSLAHTSDILQQVTKCYISYISLRNKFRTTELEPIRDDGILMYMVMMLNDVTQPLALSIIRKKSAAKYRSHVLLLVRQPEGITDAWLRAIFKQFWSIWLLNVVIIYWQENKLHIYRTDVFNNYQLIGVKWNGELPTLTDLFPKTIPDMRGWPLRMCIYPDEVRAIFHHEYGMLGTDGLLSTFLAERLNATPIVSRTQPYYAYNNLSADACFREISLELDDVAMNTRFLVPENFAKNAEFTISLKRDDLCVILPKAGTAPTFWNISHSFGKRVWVALFLAILMANMFCYLMNSEHRINISLQLFACALSLPLGHAPRRCSLRCFLLFWMFFGLLICTAFKGNLTSSLVFHRSLPDIDTMRQLANSTTPIMVRSRHTRHLVRFLNADHQVDAQVRRLLRPVPDELLLNHFNNNDRSFGYVEKYHIASFQMSARRHMQYGRPVFHLMRDCLVPFLSVYIVPYGSPHLGAINTLLRRTQEYGFEHYWERIMNAGFIHIGAKVVYRNRDKNVDPVVLQLEHFSAVFFFWAMGMTLASLVLVGEWIAGKLRIH